MAGIFSDAVLDAALQYIETNGDVLHILDSATMTWSEIATKSLGNKTGITYDGPADGTSGRKTVVDAITGGSVTASGTASHFAITDGTSAVLVCQALDAPQVVTSGNTFTLTAATLQIDDPTA